MNSQNVKKMTKKRRVYMIITGLSFLLALLTVTLCAMAGLFDFKRSEREKLDTSNGVNVGFETSAPYVKVTPDMSLPVLIPPPSPSPTPPVYLISIVSGIGGKVEPNGLIEVKEGKSLHLSIIPDPNYELSELKIDGQSLTPVLSYDFSDVRDDHTVYCVFKLKPAEPTQTPEPTPPETPLPTEPAANPTATVPAPPPTVTLPPETPQSPQESTAP